MPRTLVKSNASGHSTSIDKELAASLSPLPPQFDKIVQSTDASHGYSYTLKVVVLNIRKYIQLMAAQPAGRS